MSGIRIAIVGNQAFSLINFRATLIRALVQRGAHVYAIAPDYNSRTAASIVELGATPLQYPLSRTGLNPLADLRSVWALKRILSEIKPDVCLSYAAKPAIYGTLAAWLEGVPQRIAMIEGFGYAFADNEARSLVPTLLRKVLVSLYRLSLRRAQTVLFLNLEDLSEAKELGIVSGGQSVCIGGIGVDLSEWRPAPPVVSPLTFTFVGRMLKDKGVLQFVEAAHVIKTTNPEVRFVMVGGADDNPGSVKEEDLRRYAKEGVIEWVGHTEVKPQLEATSVFVLPSFYREGVPRSTQEAMAMARPVITTDSIGCRDTVVHRVNGFLVEPRSVPRLVEAMREFICDPQLVVQMGLMSRALAEERFDCSRTDNLIIQSMGL